MQLNKVYIRFYKSFNYDYERKYAQSSTRHPWEELGGAWYPYVRLGLEPSITTIVGANEAGKSHLLDAIEKVISGRGISRGDFCRYSYFFSVERNQRRHPDFGAEFEVATEEDEVLASEHLNVSLKRGDRFSLFRPNGQQPIMYVAGQQHDVALGALEQVLPSVFRVDAKVPLPASIPLYKLAQNAKRPSGSRASRRNVIEKILGKTWASSQEFSTAAPSLFEVVKNAVAAGAEVSDTEKEYALGRDLLIHVARIDPSTFEDLADAISREQEGYVNGIIQKINEALAARLNFPRWWAQDRDFRLMISPREYDLVFTIRDRTGTDYSFDERSNGLKYFLSYHVQLLAHQPPLDGRPEILLMDEPDAYLSSQGQQDLLRILEEFATPEDASRRDQVVYVTHSPFLINRNAADRIRVLDKGVSDEGTRVVKDAARNHYEPLRSSLGTFAAETSFIGGSNLFVEGLADQVLLAGTSAHLIAAGAPRTNTIDLNTVTIVPAGSASSVPYLIYLARGRDVVRPPCVALLDSDDAGDEAVRTLARGIRGKQILPNEFIIQIGDWAKLSSNRLTVDEQVVVTELEDLIPIPVAVRAARNYMLTIVGVESNIVEDLTDADVATKLEANAGSIFDSLKAAIVGHFGSEAHIEKVGFAKEVVALLRTSRKEDDQSGNLGDLERNFGLLLAELSLRLRRANQQEMDRRLNNRLARAIKGFLADFPSPTTRERGRLLVEEIQGNLEDSERGDALRLQLDKLMREFRLDENLTDPIDDFDRFRERVRSLRYIERFVTQGVNLEEPDTVSPQQEANGTSTDQTADKDLPQPL